MCGPVHPLPTCSETAEETHTDMRRTTIATGLVASAAAAIWVLTTRPGPDPAHAPGKRHLRPVGDSRSPGGPDLAVRQDQPWVRRSHSDSQRRRFRRGHRVRSSPD